MTDYISREAVKAILDEYIIDHPLFTDRDAARAVKSKLDTIPAADVQEVRPGKWEQTTEPCGWRDYECASCSVCGESFVLDEWGMEDMKNLMHYCPNCGAKMEA